MLSKINDTKLILQFMGCKTKLIGDKLCYAVSEPRYGILFVQPEDCLFHSSWDWLMSVVHKIDDVCPIDVKEINNQGLSIFEISLMTPLEEVYESVIEFIKWYNTQNNE